MSAIATTKFRVHNAEQFLEAFDEASNTLMYLYIGGVLPFTDDNNPPTPVNTTANVEFVPWRDSIAAKRVNASDAVHVVTRYDWVSGTIYDQYDDEDTDLLNDDFYVLTEDYNVYKCLYNNGGAASTAKPTGTSTSAFTAVDGYIWKYMYTITTADALKFLTNDYMPVRTNSTVSSAAVDGSVQTVFVTNGGSGYTSTPSVAIDGDGTGATATATVSGNQVVSIEVNTPGSGYTTATATISGGGGASAEARVIISPAGGHGFNAIEELGGRYIMLNVRLDGNEANTVSTANDFRKLGLIRDPYEYGTTTRAVGSNYRQTYRYTVPDANANYVVDSTVIVGSNTATVVEWDSTNKYLYTTKPGVKDFANGETITESGTGTVGTITAINTPGLEPYSGDVLYIENRSPISRSDDQIEDVKLIIEF